MWIGVSMMRRKPRLSMTEIPNVEWVCRVDYAADRWCGS